MEREVTNDAALIAAVMEAAEKLERHRDEGWYADPETQLLRERLRLTVERSLAVAAQCDGGVVNQDECSCGGLHSDHAKDIESRFGLVVEGDILIPTWDRIHELAEAKAEVERLLDGYRRIMKGTDGYEMMRDVQPLLGIREIACAALDRHGAPEEVRE